jgi:hypothetical protein
MKKDVLRKARKDIHSAFSRRIQSRRGRFVEIPSGPTSSAEPAVPKLKTSVDINYTFDLTTHSSPLQNASSAVLRGYNADKWLDATRARITARGGSLEETYPGSGIIPVDITTTPGSVHFNGEAVWDFLACGFDLIHLGHSAPKEHVAAIRAKANKDVEIIHGFMNFESISQSDPWHQVEDGMWAHSGLHWLQSHPDSGDMSDGLNRYFCSSIDKYEKTDMSSKMPWTWPFGTVACAPNPTINFSKHTWECEVASAGYCDSWALVVLDHTEQESWIANFMTGSEWQTEGVIVDNILNTPEYGTATNDLPAPQGAVGYVGTKGTGPGATGGSAQKGMLGRMNFLATNDARGKFKIWGNCADNISAYSSTDLAHRFIEHFFRKYDGGFQKRLLTELEASIELMVTNNIRMNVGGVTDVGQIDAWFTSTGPGAPYGTWADILAKVVAVDGLDYFFAQACRTSSNCHLFWQPEFEEPA